MTAPRLMAQILGDLTPLNDPPYTISPTLAHRARVQAHAGQVALVLLLRRPGQGETSDVQRSWARAALRVAQRMANKA